MASSSSCVLVKLIETTLLGTLGQHLDRAHTGEASSRVAEADESVPSIKREKLQCFGHE